MLIRAALGFALFETLLLAGILLAWAHRVPGARLLAAFLVGIAVWMTGNELPNWFGPGVEPLMLALVAAAPLTSAFFFHFCCVFCGVRLGRAGVAAAYLLGGSGSLLALLRVPGYLVFKPDIGWIAVANATGLVASIAWVILGTAGVAVLLGSLARAKPPAFNQIAAVTASCLWGLLCLAGYGIALSDLTLYPFPLLGFPLYPVMLVYGILRYGVFVANAWARRALVWALLLALGAAVVALTPLLPFESRWLGGLAVAASCLALTGPLRQLAERLVYPGGTVSVADLAAWRRALQAPETPEALAAAARPLLGRRIGTPVDIAVGTPPPADATVPQLVCTAGAEGWQTQLRGWEAAPPGPRQVAELFGTVLAEAAARVEQAQQIAARERERQLQARLAELGSLAATVAHDIRNPLNIISMAVAMAPAETRREVADQVGRISHLTRDLLDYAKPWKLNVAPFDVAAHIRSAVRRMPGAQVGRALQQPLLLTADAARVDQALTNLLENARSASGTADGAESILVDAQAADDGLRLMVCDNGPGVPPEIRDRMFEPFASRSAGGTGLGLAIVARIMAAHGGSVALTERPGWRTCFTLHFPSTP